MEQSVNYKPYHRLHGKIHVLGSCSFLYEFIVKSLQICRSSRVKKSVGKSKGRLSHPQLHSFISQPLHDIWIVDDVFARTNIIDNKTANFMGRR